MGEDGMRISVLLGGGAALALAFAASAAAAGGTYGAGQCGPNGCGTPGPVGFGPGQVTNEDYPPNAAPGQCFTKVLVPEVTETLSEKVLVSPEKTDIEIIPGGCRMEDKSVLVKEASEQLLTIPASYKTVTETIEVPGYTKLETVPAVYETVTEQVKVKEGYTAWRPGATVAGYAPGSANTYGSGAMSRPQVAYGAGVIEHNPAYGGMTTKVLPTGEVLCLVEVPPEYKTITRQVLKTPARVVEVHVPAEVKTVPKQVVDIPAHVEKRIVPAVYETVKVKVCAPDSSRPHTTPAIYSDYTKTRVVTPSRFEWKQVDCRTDVVHADYAPQPPMRSYGEAPPPPPHHYAPPVKTYGEAPKPVYHKPAPPKVYAPAPSYGAAPVKHGKQCHTMTTCDDEPVPAATYAPAPKPAYTKSEMEPTMAPAYSNGGGDRAVVNLQAALAGRGYYTGPQNGLFTQDTMRAMVKYQQDNHLAEGRYTGETANSLGIASR